jgi:Protein of unknown function (DUF1566).
MNKLTSIICFCLVFLFIASCERPDLTSDIERAYDYASCITIDGNMWSPKASSTMNWDDAVSYCNNLTECDYWDWHLPTISELRTLIQNCSGTVTGGSCGVTDSCLSASNCRNNACYGCGDDDDSGNYSKKYSKLGDTEGLRSSSLLSDDSDMAWFVNFGYKGQVYYDNKEFTGNVSNDYYVRCVR